MKLLQSYQSHFVEVACGLHAVQHHLMLCYAALCCAVLKLCTTFRLLLYALQALRLRPVAHHQQLLVQLLQHLLAGCGLSACWGAAERQQRISRLLLLHPLGCHWLNPLDPSLRHSQARAPVRLSPTLVFTSKGHRPSCNGGALLCVWHACQPYIICLVQDVYNFALIMLTPGISR